MNFNIKNNSSQDLSQLTNLVREFYPYAKKHMGFNRDANIFFESDLQNAKNPLGKTAYYNPSDYSVTIYVDSRHPKDIMRSLNHELVHHSQNCAGKFENLGPTEEGYAQSDPYLREMEEEAYKDMTFRDWENQKNIKEKKKMKLTEDKLRRVIREAIQKALGEQSKTDRPDRVAGRDAGGRRLDEEDEEIDIVDLAKKLNGNELCYFTRKIKKKSKIRENLNVLIGKKAEEEYLRKEIPFFFNTKSYTNKMIMSCWKVYDENSFRKYIDNNINKIEDISKLIRNFPAFWNNKFYDNLENKNYQHMKELVDVKKLYQKIKDLEPNLLKIDNHINLFLDETTTEKVNLKQFVYWYQKENNLLD